MTLSVAFMSYGVTIVGGTFQYGAFKVVDSTGAQATASFPAHFVLSSSADLVDPMTDETGQAIKAALAGTLAVADDANAAFSTATPLSPTASSPLAAGRSVGAYCSTPGDITLTLAGGTTIVEPLQAGWQTFPFAATAVALGQGTVAALYNLA